MAKQIFVNLPVKDLNKSKEFFTKIGYSFNEKFTDHNAACLVIGDNIYAMLLTESFFKSFIRKELADCSKSSECIVALSAESKEEVDEIIQKAFEAGAGKHNEKQDQGWMYSGGFKDLDGHLWEYVYMDMAGIPQ